MASKMFDYSNLNKRMKKLRYNQTSLSKAANIDRATLNSKMTNKSMFKQSEIISIAHVLDISVDEIGRYFFCPYSKENMTEGEKNASVV
ncbi:DUF739 family protein [uncultured Limosilactobacillus sp.]|uniref:DUF739 family protein n=1 Tax=uncultured Limosilactobacillus sp. TaxID=2837629 RepID=UPI0025FECD1E|nr:DUF739 family protein [uncultured Limosilactobacillus sp.]